jgi:hypothetical protein
MRESGRKLLKVSSSRAWNYCQKHKTCQNSCTPGQIRSDTIRRQTQSAIAVLTSSGFAVLNIHKTKSYEKRNICRMVHHCNSVTGNCCY